MTKQAKIALTILACFLLGVHQGFFSDDKWWFIDNQLREIFIYYAFAYYATGAIRKLLIVIGSLSVIEMADELMGLNVHSSVMGDRIIVLFASLVILYILSNKRFKWFH